MQWAPGVSSLEVDQLLQWLRAGSLHYETKLMRAAHGNEGELEAIADSDIKGLLLGALRELGRGTAAIDLRRALLRQLDQIEGQQAANLLVQSEGRALQFQLPWVGGGNFGHGAIAVEKDQHGGNGAKALAG